MTEYKDDSIVIISAGVTQAVFSGGTASNCFISSGGRISIDSGGLAQNATISSGGSLTAASGGTMNGGTILAGGAATLDPSALITGQPSVYGTLSGGLASGGCVVVHLKSGGMATGVRTSAQGAFVVSSGGTLSGASALSGGTIYTYSGGTSFNTQIQAGGQGAVTAGGTEIIANGAGSGMYAVGSGFGDGTGNTTGVGAILIGSGGTGVNETVHGGYIAVQGIGAVSRDTVITGNGWQDVGNNNRTGETGGGVASGTVLRDGKQFIFSGGTASNSFISSGGRISIDSGGLAQNATISSGGSLTAASGGTMDWGTISTGGKASLDPNALITGQPSVYGSLSGGLASGAYVVVRVQSGGVAAGVRTSTQGGIYVSSGGTLSGASALSGGSIYTYSGGTSFNTQIQAGGQGAVTAGGTEIIANGAGSGMYAVGSGFGDGTGNTTGVGAILIGSGGTGVNETVHGGYIAVQGIGAVSRDTVITGNGWQDVGNLGVASGSVLSNGGRQNVMSGGRAMDTHVSASGRQNILSGGIVTNTVITSGGLVDVSSGGIIAGGSISSGGFVRIDAGGMLSGQIINEGNLSGGSLQSSVIQNSGGSLFGVITVDGYSMLDGGAITSGATVTMQGNSNLRGSVTNFGTLSGGYAKISGSLRNTGTVVGNGLKISSVVNNTGGLISGVVNVYGSVNGGAISGELSVKPGGSISGAAITSKPGSGIVSSGGVIADSNLLSGVIQINSGGTLTNNTIAAGARVSMFSGAVISGSLSIQNGASVSIYNEAGGSIDLLGAYNAALTISGLDSGGLSNTKITGFSGIKPGQSDALKVAGIRKNDIKSVSYPDDDHVTFTLQNGSVITLNIIGAKAVGYSLSQSTDGNLIYEVCFLEGTLIQTPFGDKAIETLSVGDEIMAYDPESGNLYKETVKWIGRRRATTRRNAVFKDQAGYPVKVRSGAIKKNIPYQDLLITAEHCLFMEGHFVPVRLLVNGGSIFYDDSFDDYDYFHIETLRHSIIIANGVRTESYLDTGNRAALLSITKDDVGSCAAKTWNDDGAAPLGVTPAFVEPLYRRLEDRALSLGFSCERIAENLISDAQITLLLPNGSKILPLAVSESLAKFILPSGNNHVRLISNAVRPCDVKGSFYDDRRLLGIRVGQINQFLSDSAFDLVRENASNFKEGWYEREADGSYWTNGDALLLVKESLSDSIISVEILQKNLCC